MPPKRKQVRGAKTSTPEAAPVEKTEPAPVEKTPEEDVMFTDEMNEEDLEAIEAEMQEAIEGETSTIGAGEVSIDASGLDTTADVDDEDQWNADEDMEPEVREGDGLADNILADGDKETEEKTGDIKSEHKESEAVPDKHTNGELNANEPKQQTEIKPDVKTEAKHTEKTEPDVDYKNILKNEYKLVIDVVKKYITSYNSKICIRKVKDWQGQKLSINLEELLKKLENEDKTFKLKSNSLFRARETLQTRKRRLLRVTNLPKAIGREGAEKMFAVFGKILAFSFVGNKYPLESILITLDTEEACQSAINELDGTTVEGHPDNKITVVFNEEAEKKLAESAATEADKPEESDKSKREKFPKERKSPERSSGRVDVEAKMKELIEGMFEIAPDKEPNVIKHLRRGFGRNVARGMSIGLKSLMSEALKSPFVIVTENFIEHPEWEKDKTFVKHINSCNKIHKIIFRLCTEFTGHVDYFAHFFCKELEYFTERVTWSDEKLVKLIFQENPEIEPTPETVEKYDLPKVNHQWLLIDNLPFGFTAMDLKSIIMQYGTPQRIVMLRRTNTSAVVKMATGLSAQAVTIKMRGKVLGDGYKDLRVKRYTGEHAKLENNTDESTDKKEKDKSSDKSERPTEKSEKSSEKSDKSTEKPAKSTDKSEKPDKPKAERHTFEGEGNSRNVLIDNIPRSFSFDDLRRDAAKIGSVEIIRPIKGGTKCFVQMKTVRDAARIIDKYNDMRMPGSERSMRALFSKIKLLEDIPGIRDRDRHVDRHGQKRRPSFSDSRGPKRFASDRDRGDRDRGRSNVPSLLDSNIPSPAMNRQNMPGPPFQGPFPGMQDRFMDNPQNQGPNPFMGNQQQMQMLQQQAQILQQQQQVQAMSLARAQAQAQLGGGQGLMGPSPGHMGGGFAGNQMGMGYNNQQMNMQQDIRGHGNDRGFESQGRMEGDYRGDRGKSRDDGYGRRRSPSPYHRDGNRDEYKSERRAKSPDKGRSSGSGKRRRSRSPGYESKRRSRSRSPDNSKSSGLSSDQMKMMMLTLSSMMVQTMKQQKADHLTTDAKKVADVAVKVERYVTGSQKSAETSDRAGTSRSRSEMQMRGDDRGIRSDDRGMRGDDRGMRVDDRSMRASDSGRYSEHRGMGGREEMRDPRRVDTGDMRQQQSSLPSMDRAGIMGAIPWQKQQQSTALPGASSYGTSSSPYSSSSHGYVGGSGDRMASKGVHQPAYLNSNQKWPSQSRF